MYASSVYEGFFSLAFLYVIIITTFHIYEPHSKVSSIEKHSNRQHKHNAKYTYFNKCSSHFFFSLFSSSLSIFLFILFSVAHQKSICKISSWVYAHHKPLLQTAMLPLSRHIKTHFISVRHNIFSTCTHFYLENKENQNEKHRYTNVGKLILIPFGILFALECMMSLCDVCNVNIRIFCLHIAFLVH